MANVTGDRPPSDDRTSTDGLDLAFCDVDDWPDWNAYQEPPSEEELHGLVFDPATSPPDGWESMTEVQRLELLGSDSLDDYDGEPAAEALEAGFVHHVRSPGATGFAGGGPLGRMPGGHELAWHAGTARQRGLGALSDAELCGLMEAGQRLESWGSGLKLATVTELDARRARPAAATAST